MTITLGLAAFLPVAPVASLIVFLWAFLTVGMLIEDCVRYAKVGKCPTCGYDLHGPTVGWCTECGWQISR